MASLHHTPFVQAIAAPDSSDERVGRIALQMNCRSDCIQLLRAMVAVMTARAGMAQLQRNRIALAVDEIYANIAEHAYDGRAGHVAVESFIRSAAAGTDAELVFDFRDYAACNWCHDEQQSAAVQQETITPGGLGLRLVQAVANRCEHIPLADGNIWRLGFTIDTEYGEQHACDA